MEEVTRFSLDYTFWLNLLMVGLAGWLIRLHLRFKDEEDGGHDHEEDGDLDHEEDGDLDQGRLDWKRATAYLAAPDATPVARPSCVTLATEASPGHALSHRGGRSPSGPRGTR